MEFQGEERDKGENVIAAGKKMGPRDLNGTLRKPFVGGEGTNV
jgi:hypothetical protein